MVSGAGLSKNSVVTSKILEELPSEDWFALRMADDNSNDLLDTMKRDSKTAKRLTLAFLISVKKSRVVMTAGRPKNS